MILQCPRCLNIRKWERSPGSIAPGKCICGSFQPWRVLKTMPPKGHVIVYSSAGWQELHGPHWIENPNGWRKVPAVPPLSASLSLSPPRLSPLGLRRRLGLHGRQGGA